MPKSMAELALDQLAAVLREALEGSPLRWSYFTDSGKKGGFFGTLAPLTATVDDEGWTHLVGELRHQDDQLRQTLQSHALDGEEAFGGALASIAHLAYHLGAVRQKVGLLHLR